LKIGKYISGQDHKTIPILMIYNNTRQTRWPRTEVHTSTRAWSNTTSSIGCWGV